MAIKFHVPLASGRLAAAIAQRQATWRAARRVTPPLMLPQMRKSNIERMAAD